ncbi:MAG: Glyoxalase/bleomycin resistance protein [uncultured bacterium (gcode 4)]|uniref:Glyoxalase/bleomycin resistance protein n=1 Tax=uncultured bacterium (gcode 4) TaxID=1234023 RepID=K2F5G9_9BACT|nr:MAG: Glyoxalase/bleomycin resistance protein [uncultured bacterium (gcode 4)]
MKRVVHFEIPSKDPLRAVKFYKGIFWWEIDKWGWPQEYWTVVTWEEKESWINWWIEKKDIQGGYVCVIDVPNIDEYSEKIIANWWILIDPKREIKWAWFLAYFKDSEWNVFWIIEAQDM